MNNFLYFTKLDSDPDDMHAQARNQGGGFLGVLKNPPKPKSHIFAIICQVAFFHSLAVI